jgi:hypothetical protein
VPKKSTAAAVRSVTARRGWCVHCSQPCLR